MNTTRREFLKISATAVIVASLPLVFPANEEITVRWASEYSLDWDCEVVSGQVGTQTQRWEVAMRCKQEEAEELKPMLQQSLYEYLAKAGVNIDELIELPAVLGA